MKQIYHHYTLWEDYPAGFYNNCSGDVKQGYLKDVVKMFSSEKLTKKYMKKAVDEWKYSLEQNFSNSSINKIAYLGQAACCLYRGVPSTATMEGWHLVSERDRNRADKIAAGLIKKWKSNNKNLQLCLNMD